MDSLRWQRVQELFFALSKIPKPERPNHLRSLCSDDEELRLEVLSLLDADEQTNSLVDGSAPAVDPAILPRLIRKYAEDAFRPYRLKHILGEGGMGVVWLAERGDIGTLVAIKILRDGSFSPARQERFAAEQRTLGQLNHPLIARIYDANTLPDGTPWFAMEYVDGVPLNQYCNECERSFDKRLQLFKNVCEAVDYAHSQAIIHRDLKPSNVLVTKNGLLKLVDFGIAKQISAGESADSTRVMTLSYASPEQIQGKSVGRQTDVYSLGVILYEIMAGSHPFDLSKSTTREAESIVLRGEAERPSVVYFRTRTQLGGHPTTSDSLLSKAAWGDLDAICFKAMDKDIKTRYRSVEALIRDLDHLAEREPLDARTPSLRYRLGKFALRNSRVIAISAGAFCLVSVVVIFLLLRLEKSRRAESAEAIQTSRIESFMLSLFEGTDKESGPASELRVSVLLDRGEAEARSLGSEPGVQATFYQTLGNIYAHLGQFDRAERLLTSSLERHQAIYGADHEKVADVLFSFAKLRLQQSRNREAEDFARRALQMHLRHLAKSDPAIARDMTYLGQALGQSGDLQKSLSVLSSALELQSAKGTPTVDLANTLNVLGDVNLRLSNIQAALADEERARVLHTSVYGDIHPSVAEDLNNMAVAYETAGDRAAAARLYQRALYVTESWSGIEHPSVSILMANSAQNLLYEGKYEDASKLLTSALAIRRKLFPESDPYIAFILSIMGKVSLREGKLDEAHATFERVLANYRAAYNERHPLVGITIGNLADVEVQRHNYAGAVLLYQQALEHFKGVLPSDHLQVGTAEVRLGDALFREHQFSEADPHLSTGRSILIKRGGDPGNWTQLSEADLASIRASEHSANR